MKVAYENDKQPNEISLTKFNPNYDSITKENYEPSESPEVKGKYPKIVFLIIINEFCERFSYYGIRTVLYIFLTEYCELDKDTATAVYHAFTVICYFSPILGAILADGYIGLYRTILSVSIFYLVGELVLTLFSLEPLTFNPPIAGPAIGLIIIAFGTGGIKPCVSAFGGNQFGPTQKHHLDSFFSVFYASINIGSLIATLLTPVLRNDIKCFGGDCYPLAFGVPCVFMALAIIIFILGTKHYKRDDEKKKTGSIITKTFTCIFVALRVYISSLFTASRAKAHWLDHAEYRFSREMINDVKAFCKVGFVFLPLPVFWALYDQQGSRWTSQAQQLNGKIGSFTIKPDQFQAINPVLIVAMVPLFDKLLYPLLAKCGLFKKQLSRMACGLILAIIAFLIAAVFEWQMQEKFAELNPTYQLKFVNLAPCDLKISNGLSSIEIEQQKYKENKPLIVNQDFFKTNNYTPEFIITGSCVKQANIQFQTNKTQTIFLYKILDDLSHKSLEFDQKGLSIGNSQLKFVSLNTNSIVDNLYLKEINLQLKKGKKFIIQDLDQNFNISSNYYQEVDYKDTNFEIADNSSSLLNGTISTETCGRYTIVLFPNAKDQTMLDYVNLVDIKPNGLSIFWQLIQIIVMSFGEVMYSVSGLSFAYSQAPVSMKSVLQAAWLMTVAVGNLIVLIVAESKFVDNQVWEYVIFAGLLFVATFIFIIMAFFYRYVEDDISNKVIEEKQ